jgi:hypothetical protein
MPNVAYDNLESIFWYLTHIFIFSEIVKNKRDPEATNGTFDK